MVSSLDNWDGSLSRTSTSSKQNPSRISDLVQSAEASIFHKKTVPDENNAFGSGHGTATGLDVNHTVCCLFDSLV